MTTNLTDTDVLGQLLELEHAGWGSLCDGTGSDFYGRTMGDDGMMVLANGAILTRTEVVEALQGSAAWRTYEIGQPRLVRIGDGAAALVYRGTGWRQGDQPPFTGAMTSVYRRRDDAAGNGGWELVLYQQTACA